MASAMLLFTCILLLTTKATLSNRSRLTLLVLGTLVSVGIAEVFAKSYNQIVASVLVFAGMLYFCFIVNMVLDYAQLVARGLT